MTFRHLLGARLCCRPCHVLSWGFHSDPAVLRVSTLPHKEAKESDAAPRISQLEYSWVFLSPASQRQPGLEVSVAEAKPVDIGTDPWVPHREGQGWPQPLQPTLLFPVAEEVEQSQGEEAEAVGGASSHGCGLCQSGRCQQGDCPLLPSPFPF